MRALLTVIIVSMFCVACTGKPEVKPEPRYVAWTTVADDSAGSALKISGVLVAGEQAPLAFDVPGVVKTVRVNVGDSFSKGEVLAELEPRTFDLQLAQRQAALEEAQTTVTLTEQQYQRMSSLIPIDAVSQSQYDVSKAERDSALSRLKTAKVQVDLARKDLNDTKITAPYNGLITKRLIEPAQRVKSGETSLYIQGSSANFEVEFSASEQAVSQMNVGDPYNVYLPALDTQVAAVVTEIGVDANAGSTYPVTLQTKERAANSRAGMTAEITLVKVAKNLPLTIPATAFAIDTDGSRYVLVLQPLTATDTTGTTNSPNSSSANLWQVKRRTVELGNVSQQQVVVSSGLRAGEPIVSRGLMLLADGDTVTRLNEGVRQFAE